MSERRQKRIIRNLPDITSAKQEMVIRDFRDIVGHFNREMFRLGLCDGNKCTHHKIVHGGHGSSCYCRRAMKAGDSRTKKFWQKMHWENCSAGRSMELNDGCRGFEPKGAPLYQQRREGRRVA